MGTLLLQGLHNLLTAFGPPLLLIAVAAGLAQLFRLLKRFTSEETAGLVFLGGFALLWLLGAALIPWYLITTIVRHEDTILRWMAEPWFVVPAAVFGGLLYMLRVRWLIAYAMTEIVVGLTTIGLATSSIASGLLGKSLGLLGGVYILVRGMDNVDKALPAGGRAKARWDKVFRDWATPVPPAPPRPARRKGSTDMRAVFVDANPSLAEVTERLLRPDDPEVEINRDPDITPDDLPFLLVGCEIAIDDHTQFPVEIVKRCQDLKHIVFLGTGARSYMDPDALAAECGVTVHIIKGYGDTAVAEHAFALMWDAARKLSAMDAAVRRGEWPRTVGMQLTGKTVGLVGTGGIGAEMARLCAGIGMRVLAWNRTPKALPGVEFAPLERVLAESDVVSLHLLLGDETRGFLSRELIAMMKPGAVLVNTARGAIVDEGALAEALAAGHVGHAALDVYGIEPLPMDHPLRKAPNTTLAPHAAFRTPEASDNLMEAALEHCRRIAREGR